VALASYLHVADKDADIELALVDGSDRLVWRTVVDPDPMFDEDPVVAWGHDQIAVAWLRGAYPSASTVRVALVDPWSGRTSVVRELPFKGRPGTPSLVWNGTRYAVAWYDQPSAGPDRLLFAQVTPAGEITGPHEVAPAGSDPDLCVTPDGFGLAYAEGDRVHQGKIQVLRLDRDGTPRDERWTLGAHPDPFADPRRPRITWTGERLAVAWEVYFSGGMFTLGEPQAYAAVLGPAGKSTPAVLLENDGASDLPALVQTGSDLLAVYARNEIVPGRTPDVVSVRLSCLASPPVVPPPPPPGPCDVHRSPATGPLAPGAKVRLTMIPRPEGGYAVLRVDHEPDPPQASFSLVDRDLRALGEPTPMPAELWLGSLSPRPGGWAVAFGTGSGDVETLLLDGTGKVAAGPVTLDRATMRMRLGVTATARGLVVAWGSLKGIRTALLDGKGRVIRAAAALGQGLEGGDCALAPLPGGQLALVFAATGAHSETSALRFVRLTAEGLAAGAPVVVSSPTGFVSDQVVEATPSGGLLVGASGLFSREIALLELDDRGKVVAPQRTVLQSYRFAGYGIDAGAKPARVFAVDSEGMQERRICDP
jgi:hypothetical protein